MKKDKIFETDNIKMYKAILKGNPRIFPRGFWQKPEAEFNAIELTKYLIENILNWKDEDIKEKVNKQLFKKYKLGGMLGKVFRDSPYSAINLAYPNRFKPWELISNPRNYWTKDTGILATKWLVEEKLKLSKEDNIKEKISYKIFEDNLLDGMLQTVFNNSIELAINESYLHENPNTIKDENSIAIIINKEMNIIKTTQGFKKCNICFGEKIINNKTCFACEGKGVFNLSKSIFKYFESLRKYDIYVSLSHEYIENNKRMIRKFPLISLLSNSYSQEYIDRFQDELQFIAISQYCDNMKISIERKNNTIQIQDIINYLVTKEAKQKLNYLYNI
jgi:hypothetical protein